MGNLLMVKFPLHAELQNSWADQTLMSKFTTTVDKNDMDKFPFHSEWQKYEQSPIPSAIAKDMGRFPFHAQLQNLWAIFHFQIITGSIIQTT